MKQRLLIILVFVLMAAVLVGLNAASYTPKDKVPDTEMAPNRSTFNPGPTGTQALYALLAETGRNVVRWQEPADVVETRVKDAPVTFVVVGPLKREFQEQEISGLLRWVSSGGRLVVIDREPPPPLITTTGNWKTIFEPSEDMSIIDADPSDVPSMTAATAAAKPVQPTQFTEGVNAIQTSKFASAIHIESSETSPAQTDKSGPPPKRVQQETLSVKKSDPQGLDGPVVHFASQDKGVVVDVPYGSGRIVYVADPYIVSNGGVGLVDNARFAVNVVGGQGGPIAFDEYHHGYGANSNRFVEFFAGTPVIAIFVQCAVLLGLVFFSQSRRFGRPIPADEPDRLSKLEYVSAMAELQRRTKAYDLAIENIYKDFRRRAARALGVDSRTVTRAQFAAQINVRTGLDRQKVEDMMFKCEDIIAGEPTNKSEVIGLVAQIRDTEHALGLRKRPAK